MITTSEPPPDPELNMTALDFFDTFLTLSPEEAMEVLESNTMQWDNEDQVVDFVTEYCKQNVINEQQED